MDAVESLSLREAMLFYLVLLIALVGARTDVSPCPRLFVYEGKSSVPNRWYGILTVLANVDLKGVWIRVIFDKPTVQLGNWFGEPVPQNEDHTEYLIKNKDHVLKSYMPTTVRFYVDYDPKHATPRLQSFHVNGKVVCPDEDEMPTTEQAELLTSNPLATVLTADRVGDRKHDVFPGDFAILNRSKESASYECGLVVARPRPLITHGFSTEEGQFPWHAALYYAKGIDLTYICGAALITKSHAVTVAHCVTRRRSATPLNTDYLLVYLGKYHLKKFSGVGLQDRQVVEIAVHPKYDPSTYGDDIGLLKMDVPVEVTDHVRPVCLWSGPDDLQRIVGETGTVVGWGFDETGKVTERLMQANMPVVSSDTCIYSFPDFYSRFTTQKTFCAGYRNGTSVCNGDSGGAMVFPKDTDGKRVWQVRGLVSISVALQNQFKCDSSHYVVFTDVAKYLDWINQIVL